jgi:hypothetical protein
VRLEHQLSRELLRFAEVVGDPSVADALGAQTMLPGVGRPQGRVDACRVNGCSGGPAEWDFETPAESQTRAEPSRTEGIAAKSCDRRQAGLQVFCGCLARAATP